MNCRQARIDLALCVGEDLPDAARRESLRQHVAQCPGCRAHYKRLRGTLRVLESSDRDRTYDVGGSLWPQLSNRIRRLEESPGPSSRFNGWLPFVAVTAACAMLVVVMDLGTPSGARTPHTQNVARDMIPRPWGLPDLPRIEEHNVFLPAGSHRNRSPEADPVESLDRFTTEKARLPHNPPQTSQND
jgi:hypothetical protein